MKPKSLKKVVKINNFGHKNGFTLIELLVMIAIIGLMAVAVVASLNSVRAKARDAKRISDIKQMSKLLETQDAASWAQLTGCFGTVSSRDVRLCTGPGDIGQFNTLNFQDPSNSATICNNTSADVCQYSIRDVLGGNRPQTSNYEICFYLENPMVGVSETKGLKKIVNGGDYQEGCLGS